MLTVLHNSFSLNFICVRLPTVAFLSMREAQIAINIKFPRNVKILILMHKILLFLDFSRIFYGFYFFGNFFPRAKRGLLIKIIINDNPSNCFQVNKTL